MSIPLVVNNNTFNYPQPGDPKGWGQEATDWASEVTTVLGNLQGSDDITQTSFNFNNNVTSFTDVSGLAFSTTSVRAATIEYSIYRSTTIISPPSSSAVVESGIISIAYNSNTSSWEIVRTFGGDAGMTFTVTAAGQVQFKSSNITSDTHSGNMRFRARTLSQ